MSRRMPRTGMRPSIPSIEDQSMNARPMQTGSNLASTPLSVYQGVHPDESWNSLMQRICLSVQRSNQCNVPRGTRIRSPGSTSMPTTGEVLGLTWKIPRPCTTKRTRSEEHTSELQSLAYLVCRLLLEKKKKSPVKCRETNSTALRRQLGRL